MWWAGEEGGRGAHTTSPRPAPWIVNYERPANVIDTQRIVNERIGFAILGVVIAAGSFIEKFDDVIIPIVTRT